MSTRNHLLMPVAAVLFGLTACGSTPGPAPLSAAPTSAAPASAAPASAAPTSAAPAPEASNRPVKTTECPSVRTLERLYDLPKDTHFVPSSVDCWKGWAWAGSEGPTPGDGIYLFQHRAGKGWQYHSQGSGYHCKEIGINEAAPFCQYP